MDIWDTAGQDRYKSLVPSYYKKASGAVLVYDISSRDSFNNLYQWMTEIRQNAEPDILTILVGNKTDQEAYRVVEEYEGTVFAKENNLAFIETCALNNLNIDQMFYTLWKEIYDNIKDMEMRNGSLFESGGTHFFGNSTVLSRLDHDKKRKKSSWKW